MSRIHEFLFSVRIFTPLIRKTCLISFVIISLTPVVHLGARELKVQAGAFHQEPPIEFAKSYLSTSQRAGCGVVLGRVVGDIKRSGDNRYAGRFIIHKNVWGERMIIGAVAMTMWRHNHSLGASIDLDSDYYVLICSQSDGKSEIIVEHQGPSRRF